MNRTSKAAAVIALGLASTSTSAQVAASAGASSGAGVSVTGPATPGQTASARADIATQTPGKDAVADMNVTGDVKRAVRKSRHDATGAANSGAAIEAGNTAKSGSKSLAPGNGN